MGANLDKDNISNEEKVKQVEAGLKSLSSSIDEQDDIYKLVFLEVLFEELYKKDNILHYNNKS